MTPNEITTLIASRYGKELDVPYKKIIYERVKYWRSTLIKQSLDKVRIQARFFRQRIYMPMEEINFTALVAPVPITDYRAQSVRPIPLPLRITDNGLFNYVGGIDGHSPFGFADAGTAFYMQAGKYSRYQTMYQWMNNYVITKDLPTIPIILIDGVFNEPEEAMKFYTATYNPNVDWWDTDIPISGDIEQRVVQCIITVDLDEKGGMRKPEDYQVQMNDEQQ